MEIGWIVTTMFLFLLGILSGYAAGVEQGKIEAEDEREEE